MQKQKMNNRGSAILSIIMVALIMLGVFGVAFWGYKTDGWGLLSQQPPTGEEPIGEGPWSNQFVYYTLNAKNFFTSSAVNPTFEVFDKEPTSCWDNPRETSCTETFIGSYSATNGSNTIKDLKPGKYFAIARLSGYYSEYQTITLPNGNGIKDSLSEYNQAPYSANFGMKQADTLSISNATVTVSANSTGKEDTVTSTFTVSDDKCIRLWKYVVYENNYSLTDYGTQVSYEGLRDLKITVNGGIEDKILSLGSGITNGFNTDGANQQFEVDLESRKIEVCDGKSIEFKVYTKKNTKGDGAGVSGDQLFSANETISKVSMYDVMGTKIPASDFIRVKGNTA
jgi:hypothetical protein